MNSAGGGNEKDLSTRKKEEENDIKGGITFYSVLKERQRGG